MIRRASGTWAPIIVAAVVAAVLLAATFFIWRGVRSASTLVASGLGQAFAVSGWQQLGGPNYPPGPEQLRSFLEQHREDGLRYVAVYSEQGQLLSSAGEAKGGDDAPDGLTLVDGRARLSRRLMPRRPPPALRQLAPEERLRLRPRLPRVVYEFEPLAALALQRRSRDLLVVALLSAVGVMGLALSLTRSLRQRDRLRGELEHGRRLAALGSMSAVLAHELRNPLASLKGHAQLLAEAVEADAALAPKAGRVVLEAVRLERLMDDLLTFVKSGELQLAPADPNDVLRAAVEAAGAANVRARYLAQPSPVTLDAARMTEAVENVLRNAVQASPEGAPVEAEVARSNGALVFVVRDHGPGIPAGEEERIFEPFVTGRTRGVGLGLAITRRIVELHGGTISARNAPGGGAELVFRLPAKER